MTTAEKYVTAAYLVVLAVVLLYVVIYSFRMARMSQELAELAERAKERAGAGAEDDRTAPREETPVH